MNEEQNLLNNFLLLHYFHNFDGMINWAAPQKID